MHAAAIAMGSARANTSSNDMMTSDNNGSRGDGARRPRPTTMKQQMYARMFELMNLGTHRDVVDMVMRKVGNNLKFWAESTKVVEKTLNVFDAIATGYASARFLISLSTVQFLIENHSEQDFPFLTIPDHTRLRTQFYRGLSRLVFMGDFQNTFRPYLSPILRTLSQ